MRFVPSSLLLLILAVPCAGQGAAPKETSPDESPHASGFVTVNGLKLHYLDWGGNGEALVFLHGLRGTAHVFDDIAPKFSDRFRVLGLTWRGHGESDKPSSGYNTATLIEDLRQFLDHLNIEHVHLVGHSLAGDEMTRFAISYPDRVGKLVYLDAAYDRSRISDLLARDPIQLPRLSDLERALIKGIERSRPNYREIQAPALSFYALWPLSAYYDFPSGADAGTLKKARAFFDRDVKPWQQESIKQFRKEMVNGRVVEMPDTDHLCFIERQDKVVREMRAFLLGETSKETKPFNLLKVAKYITSTSKKHYLRRPTGFIRHARGRG